jgi:hypothetical protein
MLEQTAALQTWALEKMPTAGESVLAEQLADHRLAYLEYEGQIAGDRGRVSRIATGEYETIYAANKTLVVQLRGEQLAGRLTLSRDNEKTHLWRVSLSPG